MRLTISLAVSLLFTAAIAQTQSADLGHVLSQMDTAAQGFHTAEASFTFDQYTKVVNETDTQKGKLYFRRQGKDAEMAADFTEPKQYAIYSGGKAQLYNPKTDTVNEYKADKSRAQVEAFLLLGFGGGGHDLLSTYDVQYLGQETVAGVTASKLELVPKSKELRNNISKIILWVDPVQGVSLQQQMFFPGGDYRLAKYSGILLNKKLPDNAFKLKTTGKTKFVSPQG
ncbi:MAG: outer-membrane lipoprotein carrier protein LolA [Terriglobales bacterium]